MRAVCTSWKPWPVQLGPLGADAGVTVILTGAGGGKSDVAALQFLRWHLANPRQRDGTPSLGAIVGRDFKLVRRVQIAKVVAQVRRLNAPFEGVVRKVVGGQEPAIEWANGTTSLGFSGRDVDRMAGHEFSWAWIDEGDLQPEEVFTMALERQRSAKPVRLLITSTPRLAGWLRSLVLGKDPRWDRLRKQGLLRVCRWGSEDNPANDPETLALIRAALEAHRPGHARQELDGLFVGTEEAPLETAIDWTRAFVGRVELTAEDAEPVALGVDVGETHDYSWITVLGANGHVLAMRRFNANTPGVVRSRYFTYLREQIVAEARRWRVRAVRVDAAKAGKPIAEGVQEDLAGDRIDVAGVNTNARGKRVALLTDLAVAVSRGQIVAPNEWTVGGMTAAVDEVEQLRKEVLELVRVEDSRGQVLAWEAPPGAHDDGPVSVALARVGLLEAGRSGDLSGFGASSSASSSPSVDLGGFGPIA